TDAQHARRTPARAHLRHGLEHPVDQRIAGIEHDELGLVLGTAALGRHLHVHRVAGDALDVHDTGRVVARVLAREERVGQHRRAQLVERIGVPLPHASVTEFLQAALGVQTDVHAYLEKDVDDAGVLAYGPAPLRAHARIG